MNHFTPVASLLGGALIGLAASLFLLAQGRVAGISGIYGGLLRRGTTDRPTRIAFVAGLLASGLLIRIVFPGALTSHWSAGVPLTLTAGLLVGFGTQLGNGCTSGHGVCGISRMSARSIVATITFILTGMVTVFVTQHLIGVGK